MNCDFLRGMLFAFQNQLSAAQAKQLLDQIAARNADPTGYPPGSGYWTAAAVNSAIAVQQAIQPPTQASMAAIGAYQTVLQDIALVAIWQAEVTGVEGQIISNGC